MNTWLYRFFMAMIMAMLSLQAYIIATAHPRPEACINGVLMEQHELMWLQKGWLATHCMPIDKD
jgi:hypothetical protein